MNASIGAPTRIPQLGSSRAEAQLIQYALPVTFHQPPSGPGFYRVRLLALPGFARTRLGHALGYGDWSRMGAKFQVVMWWPNAARERATLSRARHRFVGKSTYAFGGIGLGCPPRWFNLYRAAVPVRVRAIERERGRIEELWTGAIPTWGDDDVRHFYAFDPLRFFVDTPLATPFVREGSAMPSTQACPAFDLADWQLPITLSSTAPPATLGLHASFAPLHVGMSRSTVIWLRGFPNEFADRRTMLRQSRWSYGGGPFDSYAVNFRNDRVTAFTTPAPMP